MAVQNVYMNASGASQLTERQLNVRVKKKLPIIILASR